MVIYVTTVSKWDPRCRNNLYICIVYAQQCSACISIRLSPTVGVFGRSGKDIVLYQDRKKQKNTLIIYIITMICTFMNTCLTTLYQHIQAKTKWRLFCIGYFEIHF